MVSAPMRPKVCVFGTHHDYQNKIERRGFFGNIEALIQCHKVDLLAEEASGAIPTFAQGIACNAGICWKNVDLTKEERSFISDCSVGTLIDEYRCLLREWVFAIRTAKAMAESTPTKESALLICGWTHVSGVADKFLAMGFDVERHVYFDPADDALIALRKTDFDHPHPK